VFVELRLNDLVEAAIDGREAFVHLFAEAADLDVHSAYLIAHVGANVVAFFFDEACKLLELGLFILWHASQYTIMGANTKAMGFGDVETRRRDFSGVGFARPRVCSGAGLSGEWRFGYPRSEAAKKDPSRLGSGQEVRPFAVVRRNLTNAA
jgi:hypothetical protein